MMKISERSISALAKIVTGDTQISPYRSGPILVVSLMNSVQMMHTVRDSHLVGRMLRIKFVQSTTPMH